MKIEYFWELIDKKNLLKKIEYFWEKICKKIVNQIFEMSYIMDSARRAVDIDNVFYLSHILHIDVMLKIGFTLKVDTDFPKYHDINTVCNCKKKAKNIKSYARKNQRI